MPVERVLNVHVGRNPRMNPPPTAKIHARISGGVIDGLIGWQSEEIRVRSSAHKTASQISAPFRRRVVEQQVSGMLGATEQRSARVQNLCGEIRVSAVERKSPLPTSMRLELGASSQRSIEVDVL